MSAANREMRKAILMLKAARPANGAYPTTPEEFERLLSAQEQLAVATYMRAGMPLAEARTIASLFHSGPAGRMMLEISTAHEIEVDARKAANGGGK